MSNTSNGLAEKGSKHWMQHFVNTKDVKILNDNIHKEDPSINGLVWLSPLESKNYEELRTGGIPSIKPVDMTFWPHQGPWWDAVASFDDEGIILVEAKAHLGEIRSRCAAKNPDSIEKIKSALQNTHKALAPEQVYDEKIWFSSYYQLANRLAFLYHLSKQGKNVRLLLLNFVDDPTHIPTRKENWHAHYEKKICTEMLGSSTAPKNVLNIYLDVKDIKR